MLFIPFVINATFLTRNLYLSALSYSTFLNCFELIDFIHLSVLCVKALRGSFDVDHVYSFIFSKNI